MPNLKHKGTSRPFECKITLGKDVTGKLIRKSFYSSKSKAEAKRKAEKFKAQYELELLCGGQENQVKILFEPWAIQCLELYKKPYVKANTYSGTYLAPVQKRLIPHFGQMALDSILPLHIQQYINDMAMSYSPESVKKDCTILAFILQHAVENGLCKTNAAASVRLPKIIPPDKRAYTQKEYDIVYSFAQRHPLGLPIMLMMETGISRSELLGLRWENIDLKNAVLYIRQGLVAYQDLDQGKWVMESSGLKNKYRCRAIPITDTGLIEALNNKPRTLRISSSKASKSQVITPAVVFHSPEGQPYQPQNWSKRVFARFMDDLAAEYPDIPKLTPHELRHTRATLWLAQGVPELMVAKLLGHCDLRMLSKVYDHTNVETLRNAISKKRM